MRRPSVLLAVAAAAAVTPASAAAATPSSCPEAEVAPTVATVAAARRATLCLLNNARVARGLPIVRTKAPLRSSAKRYAFNMMHANFFSHRTPGGDTLRRRIIRSGYLRSAKKFELGEVLAWGKDAAATPASTVREWLRSPGHRRVLLDRALFDAGIGVAFGAPVPDPGGATAATYVVHLASRT